LFTRSQGQHLAQHAPAFGGGAREVVEMEALERIRFPVEQDRPALRRRSRRGRSGPGSSWLKDLLVDDIAIHVAVLKPRTRSRFGRFDLHPEETAGGPEKRLLRRAHAFAPASGMRIGSRPAAVFTDARLAGDGGVLPVAIARDHERVLLRREEGADLVALVGEARVGVIVVLPRTVG